MDISRAVGRNSASAVVDQSPQISHPVQNKRTPTRMQLRHVLNAIALFLAFAQMWVSQGIFDPDGISYSDIAKAYLRGDWHNALNSYWSPLYSWLLAIGYVVFRPSIRWEMLVAHVINFLGFAGALYAWNWLFREWERWQGPPRHRVLIEITGFAVITWAGLHLVTLGFTSPDMEILALTIAVAAILVRVRRGAATTTDFVVLGVALAVGFLAKAAFEALIPLILIEAAVLLGTIRDRRLYLAPALALLIPLPFIIALSAAKGRFVISDTGKLNYSAQVTGMSLEGYKENAYWPGEKARHPIARLLDHPRVLGFQSHMVGTTPVHYDPPWWWEGYPASLNVPRQLMILRSNIGFCLTRFALCPALILAIVCALWGGAPRMTRVLRESWFVWLPGVAALGLYCLVYTLNRYLAGGFSLIAFCLIASSWRVRLPRAIAAGTAALVVIACLGRTGDYVRPPRDFVKDLIGKGDPSEINEIKVAENLKRAGLASGDRVALIGDSISVAWLSLVGGTTVAAVPETIGFDDRRLGRTQTRSNEKSEAYWRSDAEAKRRVMDAFRSVGAKWIVACNVPRWANTEGWEIAGRTEPADPKKQRPQIFYKRLD